jgi:hypothetical protein
MTYLLKITKILNCFFIPLIPIPLFYGQLIGHCNPLKVQFKKNKKNEGTRKRKSEESKEILKEFKHKH